jgi:anti-sigma-K factor RskA
MNIWNHPELVDHLASSHALGTLRGGARRRFETLAREHPSLRAATLLWQSRLASLNELQPAVAPGPSVWTRIDNLLDAEADAHAMAAARQPSSSRSAPRTGAQPPTGWLHRLGLWRSLTAAGALATVVLGVGLLSSQAQRAQLGTQLASVQQQLQNTPQISYVAVLADEKAAPSMLVTFDPKNKRLVLQRVGSYQEAGDRSLQLWALPPGQAPRSLGVLGHDKLLQLTAAEGDVQQVPALAISLEPQGGVPSAGGPTGPVLFSGALIQKML